MPQTPAVAPAATAEEGKLRQRHPGQVPQRAPLEAPPAQGQRQETARLPLFLEICAGCARLSKHFEDAGFRVIAIDHKFNDHVATIPCMEIDLSSAQGAAQLMDLVQDSDLAYVHFAPPCGTCSRAREMPLSPTLQRQGLSQPKPLRDARYPEGLPSLSGKDLDKVTAANNIYKLCCAAIRTLLHRGVAVSVENPTRSWMWNQPCFEELSGLLYGTVDFQACAHGGRRPKWSRFRTALVDLSPLALRCPGNHEHAPWRATKSQQGWLWSTAEEAEYPAVLCQRVAALAAAHVTKLGWQLRGPVPLEAPSPRTDSLPTASVSRPGSSADLYALPSSVTAQESHRATAGTQPRGYKVKQLVPEGREVQTFTLLPGQSPEATLATLGYSKYRVLRQTTVGIGGAQSFPTVTVILPWTNEEFIQEACKCQHPFDSTPVVDDEMGANFRAYLLDPSATVRERLKQRSRITAMGLSLQAENDAMLASCPPHVRRILKGKNVALFRALLKECGHPDHLLVDEMLQGSKLTGLLPKSGVFPSMPARAMMSEKDLLKASVWVRPRVLGLTTGSGSSQLDCEVWEATLEEVANGWLEGPVEPEQLDLLFPNGWVPARRFAVTQADKMRLIDDYSLPQVNAAFSASERILLDDVDRIGGLAKFMMMAALQSGKPTKLLGRTLDLRAAYRQLGVASESGWAAVVAVYCPGQARARLFRQLALPFGASASVWSFNRFSRAIHRLGISIMKLTWCVYFDDFPIIEPEASQKSAYHASLTLLAQLGWDVSSGESKSAPFADVMPALGVEFDLTNSALGICLVRNKASRVVQLRALAASTLESGLLLPREAASMRGRYQYAEGQTFGHAACAALFSLGVRSRQQGCQAALTEDLRQSVGWLAAHVTNCPPRRVPMPDGSPPLIIFTDGAFEPGAGGSMVATCGGVLVDGGRCHSFFGAVVPARLTDLWSSEGSKQLIGQIELMPVLLARRLWARQIQGRKIIFFLDNEAGREGLVKGFSPAKFSRQILQAIAAEELRSQASPWFARVSTHSNIADAPSRLDFADMQSRGARAVTVPDHTWNL